MPVSKFPAETAADIKDKIKAKSGFLENVEFYTLAGGLCATVAWIGALVFMPTAAIFTLPMIVAAGATLGVTIGAEIARQVILNSRPATKPAAAAYPLQKISEKTPPASSPVSWGKRLGYAFAKAVAQVSGSDRPAPPRSALQTAPHRMKQKP
jgi:hypothetical protein